MPRNSLVNGKTAPDSFGTQLDETAYPILMAQQLGLTDAALYANHIKPAANFLDRARPVVRRRALGGAGRLLAVHDRGRDRRPRRRGRPRPRQRRHGLGRALARRRRRLAALDQGLDGDDERAARAHPYFIRLSKTGDPNAAISYNVGNGGPTLDQRAVIDAGFLELVRLGELPANDPDVVAVAAGRRRDDPVADGERARLAPLQRRRLRRPRERRPAVGAERPGHRPPLAGAVRRARRAVARDRRRGRRGVAARGHERVRVRRRADPRAGLGAVADLAASPFGTDPTLASIGFRNGGAAGSASPLTWSAASFVRLDGRPRRRAQRRPARRHELALRRTHAGHDDADGDEPGRRLVGRRLAGDGHRHDRARQPGLRLGDEHRRRTRRRRPPRPRPPPTARSASTSRSRAARACSTSSP